MRPGSGKPAPPPRPSLPPGSRVDRYVVEATLGTGGFGTVYRARHAMLGHAVAVKLLHPDHLGSASTVERFFREARAAAAIGSPHIAQVLDCGTTPEGLPFIVMELLAGVTLQDLLDAQKIVPVERTIGIALQVLDGLAAAHSAGIVHRDLKPANVFISADPDGGGDFVKLLDFGISKMRTANASQITGTGVVMGTPVFMAPEQFRSARDVDGRADLYAASVVTYLMSSGRVPFKGDSYEDMVVKINTETPAPLASVAPHVPPAITQVIDRGLARDRDARWQSAEEYAMSLRMAAGGERTPVMRPVNTARGTQSLPGGPRIPSHRPSPVTPSADPFGPTHGPTEPGALPAAMPTPNGTTAPRGAPSQPAPPTPIPETIISSHGPIASYPPQAQPSEPQYPSYPQATPPPPPQPQATPPPVPDTIPETHPSRIWLWALILAPIALAAGAGIVLGILSLLRG